PDDGRTGRRRALAVNYQCKRLPFVTPPMDNNEILIQGLDLPVQIGVPDDERAGWQVLNADIAITPRLAFEQMQDQISATINYQAVTDAVKALATSRPRHLIETLVVEIAALIINEFAALSVTVTLRKRILPGTDNVAVRIVRTAEP
ncbi:MAG: Haloacid dehalogenase domain protein hydrolase, partial [Verrucomicrobiaceae bacterium]|nr:Haloacid dehalogenase domain protein hydrolase [Verrucomicrobiaceae bacterium]